MSTSAIRSVGIIGAGIGGLTLAQLLRIRAPHLVVKVFERDISAASRSQGYVLGLIPAGMAVLNPVIEAKNTSLQAMFNDERNALSRFIMADQFGRPLLSAPAGGGVYVDRARFRQALMEDIPVQWGKTCNGYEERDDGVRLVFADGAVEEVDVVIGCDGANSRLRKQRAPGVKYRDLHLTNTTGLLPFQSLPPKLQQLAAPGLARCLAPEGHSLLLLNYTEMNGNKIALWVLSYPGHRKEWEGKYSGSFDRVEEEYSESLFARDALKQSMLEKTRRLFHEDFSDMIQRTPAADVLGPRQLYSTVGSTLPSILASDSRRVLLLGDAAHATTTHRGMGANTALADAQDVAAALTSDDALQQLRAVQQTIVKRGQKVVGESLGSTHSIHAIGVKASLRNVILRAVGALIRMSGK